MFYLRVRFNDFYSEFVVNDILLFGKARESLTSSKIIFSKNIVAQKISSWSLGREVPIVFWHLTYGIS